MAESQVTIVEYSEDVATQEKPPLLPAGDYPAQIRTAAVRESKNTGKRYYMVTFHISADAYPVDFIGGDDQGELVSYMRVSAEDTPKGRWQVQQFCNAIGATPSRRIDASEWVGLTANITIDHNVWEGEERLNIAKVSRQ